METSQPPAQISQQDEHVLAAISHAAIILPMWGLIAPVLIWITQREKSRYVAFHSLQAAIFHFAVVVAWFAGGACYIAMVFMMFAGVTTVELSRGADPGGGLFAFLFILPFVMVFLIAIASLVAVVLGVVGAVLTFQGKDFRYPLIGRWASRYQQDHPSSTT